MLRVPFWLLLLLLPLTGCLPSSCQQRQSYDLFPSDSLSQQIALAVPVDTLHRAWRVTAGPEMPLQYPRTVRFGPDGDVLVSDVERNSVLTFSARDGALRRERTDDAFDVPYLAGFRGDTVVVFNPKARRFDWLVGDAVARRVTLQEPAGTAVPEASLAYGAATDHALYFKAVGEDFDGFIARLGSDGQVVERHALGTPYWRYAGFLRPWADTLLSLSGFRPVVDVLPPGGPLDTLALAGFDSPMLARSRAYLMGEVHQAPLLTPSAAPAGDLLFVLNLRAGWLQVDAYGRDGHLRHRLTQPDPNYIKEFWPQDLDARRRPDGTYMLAVVYTKPTPTVDLFVFDPAATPRPDTTHIAP